MIENDRDIFSYKNLTTKTKLNKELVTSLILVREIETSFISLLKFYYFRNKKEKEDKNDIGDIFKFYIDFFTSRKISISEFLLTQKPEGQDMSFAEYRCKYSIITQDIFDKLTIIGDINHKHSIFRYKENYSLLVVDDTSKTITHYFSTYNDNLYNYFKKNRPEYKYIINYDLKTSSVCKINEICIVFLIFFNLTTLSDNYEMIYIQDSTLQTILKICSTYLT